MFPDINFSITIKEMSIIDNSATVRATSLTGENNDEKGGDDE